MADLILGDALDRFAYPYRNNIIPIYAAALIAFFVPFVFFVLFQIRHRSPGMLREWSG